MVTLNNLLPNGNKQQNNIGVNYSENLITSESPLKNPNYGKDIETYKEIHWPNNTYNIDVHYSTNLTHPELAPNSPLQNPVLEKTKTLNPVQEISVVARGTDPNVIANNPTHINPYVREKEQTTNTSEVIAKPTTTSTTQTTTNLTPEEVLGQSFIEAYNNPMYRSLVFGGGDLNYIANQILQITGGLTLPELFKILGFNIKDWTPYYYHGFSPFEYGSSYGTTTNNVINAFFYGNKIEFINQSQINTTWSGGSSNSFTRGTLTIEPYNLIYKGKTYHLILVKYTQYEYLQTTNPNSPTDVYKNTITTYYLIDPITKKIVYQAQTPPQQEQYWFNSGPTSSNIIPAHEAINDLLSQYGYKLPSDQYSLVDNLQPGQSITVYASAGSAGAEFTITYLGNGQYQIQSKGEFYNFNDFSNPWTSINETITAPTYNINTQTGQISTTPFKISGQITTYGTTNINMPYYIATYKVSETIPIYSSSWGGQIGFWFGTPQGGITLQNVSLPTLTYQQYIQLANGQMPQGIKPGWYYYPILNEFVYVKAPQYYLNVGNIKITNPEVIGFVQQYGNNNVLVTNLSNIGNPNELAFIYLTPNGNGQMLIYDTLTGRVVNIISIKNLKTNNPNYDLIVQMIYNQQYNGFGILYPGSNELITFQLVNPNNLNSYVTNKPIADILGSTPIYVTVDLINNTIYLQDIRGNIISTKTFSNQNEMLNYIQKTYGISKESVLQAENPTLYTLSNLALNTAVAETELEISIPLLTLTSASLFAGSLIGAALSDVGALEIDTSIPNFVKNFVMSGGTTAAFGNLASYISTGKPLSAKEDIFLFTTSGLIGAGGSILGNAISADLTNAGITGLKNSILSGLIENTITGAGINVVFGETLSLHNTGKWLSPSEVEQYAITGAEYGAAGFTSGLILRKLAPSFFNNPLGSSLAAGTINALFALPSRNPLMILGAFDIGLLSGGLNRMIEYSKIPYLEESPEVQRVLDTTEIGRNLGNKIKEKMVDAGLVSYDYVKGLTTTETIKTLKNIYNELQERIINEELPPKDIEYLKSKEVLGIRNDIILGKEEVFAKYVKDRIPIDGEKYYNAQQIIKYYTKQLDKMFGGWKISSGEDTLFYYIKSGNKAKWGFGSAGKTEEFISERSVSDITLNVAGIYNAPSDVIDTIKYLRKTGMVDDAEMLEKIYNSVKTVKDLLTNIRPSKNIEIEFRDYAEEYAKKYGMEYGELISTQMGDTIKEYLQEKFGKNAVIYGSESVRQYLDSIAKRYGGQVIRYGKEYVIIDRHGNVVWKFRMPGDVDVIINTKDPGVLEVAAEDIAKLLNKALNTNRFIAQEHLVIDKYRGGEHVVDLHMPNEGSDWLNIYARKSNFYDLGFPRPEPYYTDNLGVAKLSQTSLDKASAVATLRQLSLADLVKDINNGAKIDNPNYVISYLKNLLKNADYETQRNVLAEFIMELKPGYRNTYVYLISNSFNIPISELNYVNPKYLDIIEKYFYKKQTYIAPATYRLKDTGDTLSLIYLGGDLLSKTIDVKAMVEGREVIKDYGRLVELSKEKGILPKDWTEPNTINMEDIFKSINPFESNIEMPEMVRVGSVIGSLGSMFRSEESITGVSIISSISSGPSTSNKGSSIRPKSLSISESMFSSISSSIVSTSESLSKSLVSNSLSSSLSESISFSPSLSASISQSLSSSTSTSMSTSISTSISTSTSTSESLSSSISASIFSTSGSPSYFSLLGFGGLSNPTTNMGINLGNAKWAELDVAYAFNKLWK